LTDKEKICNVLNLKYFDFLEEKQDNFSDILGVLNARDYLDFYAEINENNNSNIKYVSHETELFIEKYNIGDNFYIGHFYYSNLNHSKRGKELLFDLYNNKAEIQEELIKELVKLIKIEEDKYHLIQESYFKIAGKPVHKIDYYKEKINSFVAHKYIEPYKSFIKKYETKKENNETFYKKNSDKPYKPTKESYMDFIFDYYTAPQTFLKKKLEAFIPNQERYRHTHITGTTGSGKSVLMTSLIFSVLRTQKEGYFSRDKKSDKSIKKIENFILIDPHGDLSDNIFSMAFKFKTKTDLLYTLILDPFLDNEKTPVINPFEFEGNEIERATYTEELLNVLQEILGLSGDLSLNAQALLTPCIATLIKLDNTSLYDLQAFMNDDENHNLVEKGKITKNFAHKNFFEMGFYSPNLTSTKRAIFLKLQTLLNNKTFSNLTTGKSTFDLEEIMNSHKNLIVKLNKVKMKETIKPFGRFLVAKIQNIALKRANLPECLRPKTHLFIDEFQNFITPSIEEILTESRKYNLFLTMAHQFITQLEDTRIKDAILSNTNIKLVGKNGHKTLNEMSKEIKVSVEELEQLEQGEFFVKVGKNQALKIYNTPLNSYYFTKNKDENRWEKEFLIEFFYAKPTQSKLVIKTSKNKQMVNSIIKDKNDTSETVTKTREPKFKDF
jgi:hypothetical protein